MTTFILKRLALAVFTTFAVLTLVFVLVRIVPGDPAQVILGDQASREAIVAMRARLGLDRPLIEQYAVFMGNVLRGDWGTSMVTGQPVIGEVLKVLPWTIELTVVSIVLGSAIGIPLGVFAAIRRNGLFDYLTRIVSLVGLSFPPFVSAIILLLVFAIEWPLFPVISARTGSATA
jgi:glutathione transport system permease protein